MELPATTRLHLLAPIVSGRKGEYRAELQHLVREGFVRVKVDGALRELSEDIRLDKNKKHDIDIAASAEEALLKLPGDYDLVISDIVLQRMDGVTLLEQVNGMQRKVPVMMISGLGGSDIENMCRHKGAAGFIQKPFQVNTFLNMVEKAGRNSYEA